MLLGEIKWWKTRKGGVGICKKKRGRKGEEENGERVGEKETSSTFKRISSFFSASKIST